MAANPFEGFAVPSSRATAIEEPEDQNPFEGFAVPASRQTPTQVTSETPEPSFFVPKFNESLEIPMLNPDVLTRWKADVEAMPEGEEREKQRRKLATAEVHNMRIGQLNSKAESRGLTQFQQLVADTPLQQRLGQAGFLERHMRQGLMKTGVLVQNTTLRTLGRMGVKGAEETADNNNRILGLQKALEGAKDRESTLAGWTSPSISEAAGDLTEMGVDIALFGGGEHGITQLATLYGLSAYDQGLTDGEDAGLKGAGKQAYALGMGALEAGIMLAVGKVGERYGFETAEEVFSGSTKAAVQKLLTRTGFYNAFRNWAKGFYNAFRNWAKGSAAEAGEEGLTAAAQQAWGYVNGVNTLEDFWSNVGRASAIGAAARTGVGAAKVATDVAIPKTETPLDRKAAIMREAYEMGEKLAPVVVKGDVDGQTFFKNAVQEEVDSLLAAETPEDAKKVIDKHNERVSPTPEAEQPKSESEVEKTKRDPMYTESFVESVQQNVEAPPPPPLSPNKGTTLPPEDAEDRTSARVVDLTRDRELMFGNTFADPEHIEWQRNIENALQQNIPDRAVQMAQGILGNPRALDADETAGFVHKMTSLKNEYDWINARMQEEIDPIERQSRAQELAEVKEQFDVINQATRLSGTEKGRNLASQKLALDRDYSLLGVVSRAELAKQSPLTEEERADYEQNVQQHQTETQALDEHIEAAKDDIVRTALKDAALPDEDVDTLRSRIKRLLDEGCDLA